MPKTQLSKIESERDALCNWINSLDNVTSRDEAQFHARMNKLAVDQRQVTTAKPATRRKGQPRR